MKINLEMSKYPETKPSSPGYHMVFMRSENKEHWGERFFVDGVFSTHQFDAPIIWWLGKLPIPPKEGELCK